MTLFFEVWAEMAGMQCVQEEEKEKEERIFNINSMFFTRIEGRIDAEVDIVQRP